MMLPRIQSMGKMAARIIFLAFSIIILSCSTEIGNPEKLDSVMSFENASDLESYMKGQLSEPGFSAQLPATDGTTDDSNEDPAGDTPVSPENIFPGERQGEKNTDIYDYRNNRSDIVLIDETIIYSAGYDKINIVDVSLPEEMNLISEIDLAGATPKAIHKYDDILVIVYSTDDLLQDPDDKGSYGWPTSYNGIRTGMLLLDVKNPAQPETLKEILIEGDLRTSFISGEKLHIVQKYVPNTPLVEKSQDDTASSTIFEVDKDQVKAMSLDDMIPFYTVLDSMKLPIVAGRLVEPENFFKSNKPTGADIISITTMSMTNLFSPFQSIGIIGSIDCIHAADDDIYLTDSFYDKKWQTTIFKVDITNKRPFVAGSGKITGKIMNSSAIDEYNGILRVLSVTKEQSDPNNTENSLFYNHLSTIYMGSEQFDILTAAPIESKSSIYNAKFDNDRAWLFSTDPNQVFYMADLKDPMIIKIVQVNDAPSGIHEIQRFDADRIIMLGTDQISSDGEKKTAVHIYLGQIEDTYDINLISKSSVTGSVDSSALPDFFYMEKNQNFAAISFAISSKDQIEQFSEIMIYSIDAFSGLTKIGSLNTMPEDGTTMPRVRFIDNWIFVVYQDRIFSADINDMEKSVASLIFKN